MPQRPHRVAVDRLGPAGFYAAAALLTADPPAEVHLLERAAVPWGLVRFGVAPDHPKHQGGLARVRADARPAWVPLLRQRPGRPLRDAHRPAALLRRGGLLRRPQTCRRLGIPGEGLLGFWGATEFVAWYNGHPDFQDVSFDLDVERAVVVGAGNVALDVARMLALTEEELAPTDTTDAAVAAIVALALARDRRARRAEGRRRPPSRRRS